jgi:hypothetical protein
MLIPMERTYVIAWTSKTRPSAGQGKKLLTREEAEQLASELNHDHPNFVHEPVNLNLDASVTQPNEANAPASQVIIENTDFAATVSETSYAQVQDEVAA